MHYHTSSLGQWRRSDGRASMRSRRPTDHEELSGMKILIAEDEALWRRLLQVHLTGWGDEVLPAPAGEKACFPLSHPDPLQLGILDWHRPQLEAPQICRV